MYMEAPYLVTSNQATYVDVDHQYIVCVFLFALLRAVCLLHVVLFVAALSV
jgi:hypothetical protein